jgi:hypothetical protein
VRSFVVTLRSGDTRAMRLWLAPLLFAACAAPNTPSSSTGSAPARASASVTASASAAKDAGVPVDLAWDVLSAGKPSGTMVVKRAGAVRDVAYEYNDRGRGVKTATHAEFDDQGVLRAIAVTGND